MSLWANCFVDVWSMCIIIIIIIGSGPTFKRSLRYVYQKVRCSDDDGCFIVVAASSESFVLFVVTAVVEKHE